MKTQDMNFKRYFIGRSAKNTTFLMVATFFLLLDVTSLNAQRNDQIITRKGNVIHANVKKIGSDQIVYRKFFRKHEMDADKVLYIVDDAGKKIEVNPITTAKRYKKYSPPTNSNASFQPRTIERVGNSWRIDTSQLVSTKQLNSILAQSPNPIVQMNLKSAKLMRTLTKITKITSYPSTLAGGFASFKTFKTVADQMKTGPVSFNSYLNAGLSFLGTLSMPITKAILNKIQKKKYDKAISLYVSS